MAASLRDDTALDLPPLQVVTAKAGLADRIATAIAIGAYSPGEVLPTERELAQRQGVSRVTVRSALQFLRERGLIATRRGRGGGNFVTDLEVDAAVPGIARRTLEKELPGLRSLVDFRCLIAGLEARVAAERGTPEQGARLQQVLADFLATDDLLLARQLDRQLHNLISEMAGNSRLAELMAQLGSAATMGFGSEPYVRKFLDQARKDHVLLVGHIVAHDCEAAYAIAYRHFSLTFISIQDVLDDCAGVSARS